MDNLAKHFNAILEKNLYLYTSLKQKMYISVLLLHPSVLKFEHAGKSPGGLVKMQVADSTPRVSDSVGLGWDLRICISNTLRFTIQKNTGTNSKYVKLKIF